jgi:ribosomal protein S18 acetylase RimI-like enzyme
VTAPEIAPLAARDLGAARELLARAFQDNPLNRAVVGGSAARRLRCNRAGMRTFLAPALAAGRALGARSRRGEGLLGALVALPPGVGPMPRASFVSLLQLLVVQRPRVIQRWSAIADALQLHRPQAPHAYLATLGVAPEAQRRGVGSALLRRWLAEIDERGERAYLETDRAESAAWYGSAGFRTRAEIVLLGVTVHLLERPPLGQRP